MPSGRIIPRELWRVIREEYLREEVSCRELAERHGITPEAVSTRCKREKWKAMREGYASTAVTPATLEPDMDAQIDPESSLQDESGGRATALPAQTDPVVARQGTTAEAFEARVRASAEEILDRIEEAMRTAKGYDLVEKLQRLTPSWKTAVEWGRKAHRLDQAPPQQPSINLHLVGCPLPPLIRQVEVLHESPSAPALPVTEAEIVESDRPQTS